MDYLMWSTVKANKTCIAIKNTLTAWKVNEWKRERLLVVERKNKWVKQLKGDWLNESVF